MLDKLKQIGYEVIEEEQLPKPIEIKFRNSLSGVMKSGACLIRCKTDESYRIIINTVRARWFDDSEGNYTDKNGNNFRKATVGEKLSEEELKVYLAHEIAHLKFWNHNTQHKSYVQHILEKINKKW